MQFADTKVIYVAYKFQIVQLRTLLIYKHTNHQQMHKESVIINRNTSLHVSIDDKARFVHLLVISVFVWYSARTWNTLNLLLIYFITFTGLKFFL
jgi:hypothetical protein